jgi:hypothetical protein
MEQPQSPALHQEASPRWNAPPEKTERPFCFICISQLRLPQNSTTGRGAWATEIHIVLVWRQTGDQCACTRRWWWGFSSGLVDATCSRSCGLSLVHMCRESKLSGVSTYKSTNPITRVPPSCNPNYYSKFPSPNASTLVVRLQDVNLGSNTNERSVQRNSHWISSLSLWQDERAQGSWRICFLRECKWQWSKIPRILTSSFSLLPRPQPPYTQG